MKFYKALVEGKNCWANLDGTYRRLGFVTTRAARASGPVQAPIAIELKLADELRTILLNEPEDVPKITVGEVCEIDEEAARGISDSGCTWYSDDIAPN